MKLFVTSDGDYSSARMCRSFNTTCCRHLGICSGIDVFGYSIHSKCLAPAGGGWIAKLGGETFGTAIAFVAIIFSGWGTNLYPFSGTMFTTTFAYFFSGFQYSVSINYEAYPIVLVVRTGYPLFYRLLFPSPEEAKVSTNFIGVCGLLMVILSLLWILHSAFYTTVVYRAVWIRAWWQQSECSNSPKGDTTSSSPPDPAAITTSSDVELGACTLPPVLSTELCQYNMRNLWVLAAGQGHPTWRTTVGQGTDFYLIVLNCLCIWQAQRHLSDSCTANFILFPMMVYSPPIFLTLSVISVQISMFRFGWKDMHSLKIPSGMILSNCGMILSNVILSKILNTRSIVQHAMKASSLCFGREGLCK